MTTSAYERTLSPWLVREDKALSNALLEAPTASSVDVFSLASELQREPVSVLRRLRTRQRCPKLAAVLEERGLWLDLEDGRDEEDEFWGLALSGVPLALAWRWCVDESAQRAGAPVAARPTTSQVESAMTSPDLRPGLALAREAGLWFADADQVESLRFLLTQSLQTVIDARRGVESRFDAPTPKVVAQGVFGVFAGLADAAAFDGQRLVFKKSGRSKASTAKRPTVSAKPRKAASSTSTRSTTTKAAKSAKPKSAYKRKRKSSSGKAKGSSSAWWAKYKRAAGSAATKTGYSGRGRGRSTPIIPESEYEISDGPRIIEYI
jgi:hypothetical protein